MIQLTRLNGESMVLNSDLIRYAEANPDTVITLVTGEKIVVAEPCTDLVARVMEYRRELLRTAFPDLQMMDPGLSTRSTATSAKIGNSAVETATAKTEAETAESNKTWRRRQRDND